MTTANGLKVDFLSSKVLKFLNFKAHFWTKIITNKQEKREKQTGFNWREQLWVHIPSKFKRLLISTPNSVCAFECVISKLLSDFQSQRAPVSRPAEPEEGFHLCRMETEGNHLPNGPAGDGVRLHTGIHTLNVL